MPIPGESSRELSSPGAADSAEFERGIRETKKTKMISSKAVDSSYVNDSAWKFHAARLQKLREEKERRERKDPVNSRLGASMNHSMSSEIKALVGDNHMRNSRENIYSHRDTQGVMKRGKDGKMEKRNEESFLREMSTPKFIKVKNDQIVSAKIHKPGFVPRSSRNDSASSPVDDESAITIETTLKETNRHKEVRDKRHLSIHESLTLPLKDLFDHEEMEAAKARAILKEGKRFGESENSSSLGHFAQPTASSAHRYAEGGHHSVMHSSGAEWWDERADGRTSARSETRGRTARQKDGDRRRSAHAHTKRVATLVADYLLQPFNGRFIDRDSHHKIPGVHRSRRRSISVSRGLISNEFGTGHGHDGANLRLVAGMHSDGRMRSRSASATPRSRAHSSSMDSFAPPGMGFGGLDSPASAASRKSIYSFQSSISDHPRDRGGRGGAVAREPGRMSVLEASVPGMYRPLTAPSNSSSLAGGIHAHAQYHEHKQRRAVGPWVPAGNKSRTDCIKELTNPDGEIRTSSLSAHIAVNQAGQERHDRMKYWVSTKVLREKIRESYAATKEGEGEGEGEGNDEDEDLDQLGRPTLTRRVSAATNATLALDRTSAGLNLFNSRGNEISHIGHSHSQGQGQEREEVSSQARRVASRRMRKNTWLAGAKGKLRGRRKAGSSSGSSSSSSSGTGKEGKRDRAEPPPLPSTSRRADGAGAGGAPPPPLPSEARYGGAGGSGGGIPAVGEKGEEKEEEEISPFSAVKEGQGAAALEVVSYLEESSVGSGSGSNTSTSSD